MFVDTPGLNSQASSDTQTTQNVLKEVDGIIWLSLIDNAGKMSELKVLEEYLGEYQNKSLCVLNQKDKFTPEQIEETVAYVKTAFGEFFSEVVPISANKLWNLVHTIKRSKWKTRWKHSCRLYKRAFKKVLNFQEQIVGMIEAYQSEIEAIKASNLSENLALLEASNITKVLALMKYVQKRRSQKSLPSPKRCIISQIL